MCTTCHGIAAATARDGYLLDQATADTHDPDWVDAMPGTGTPTNDGGGVCTDCHGTYFNTHTHTHTFAADASCATCHGNPTPATSNARDAVSAPFVGTGEVHETGTCGNCHDLDATPTGALIGSAIGQAAATGCIDCHIGGGDTWTTVHTAASGLDHATRVDGVAACATCHGNPTPGTSNARDAQATPFIVAGDVHAGGCALCHTGANNGALQSGPFTNADTITKGDWTGCHTDTSTWTTVHDGAAGVDHATRVSGVAACTVCHGNPTPGTSNARDAQATPYTVAGDVHAGGCALCHTGAADGALQSGPFTNVVTLGNGICIGKWTVHYSPVHLPMQIPLPRVTVQDVILTPPPGPRSMIQPPVQRLACPMRPVLTDSQPVRPAIQQQPVELPV